MSESRGQFHVRGVVFGFALVLLLLFVVPTPSAEADGGSHPYFNDRGTLTWYQSYAEALRVAKRERKLVFIESGRLRCKQCRTLCQSVLPDRSISSRISAIAIGLAADCDRPEWEVADLFRRYLPNPKRLPLVAFVTPDGQWVTGYWGKRTVTQFSSDLAVAESAWKRLNASWRPARPRTPTSAPEPTPAPEPAPEPAPAPTPVVTDCDPVPESDVPCGDDCEGVCEGGVCTPPPAFSGPLTENVPSGSGDCVVESTPSPEPGIRERVATTGPAPDLAANGFPSPTARETTPTPVPTPSVDHLDAPAVRTVPTPESLGSRGMPAPPPNTPHVAMGDPDAGDVTSTLPPTVTFPAPPPPPTPAPTPVPEDDRSHKPTTTSVRPASTTRAGARLKAEKSAARGQWGEVLRLTERRTDNRELLALNRKAHAWAHDTLQDAVGLLEAGDVAGAREQIERVKAEMAGRPEAEDARRGLDTIEFVQDLAYLPGDSLVRRAVTKNAYEKMRGSRWAALFR